MMDKERLSFLWVKLAIVLAVFLSSLNVLYFISQAATPLIRSDAWYFLDEVIKKWSQVGFNLSDLFVKRGMTDHAQPLNKIALLINYKFFALDFRYEALAGFIGLLFSMFIFARMYARNLIINANSNSNYPSAVIFIVALLILTSLNATELYTWPLVTFGFITLFLFICASLLTWKYLTSESSIITLGLFALLMLLIGDSASVILWASLLLTVATFWPVGDKEYRNRSAKWGVFSAFFIVLYFVALNYTFIFHTDSKTPNIEIDVNWFDLFLYIEALRIVFSSSLVQAQHFIYLGSYALVTSWVVALVVFGFYVRHFVALITSRTTHSMVKFLTTSILIYATVSVAAIAYGRIPVFGVDYLNQPRYAFTYQLIPFALMMDYAFSLSNKKNKFGAGFLILLSTAVLLLVIVQFVFSMQAHHNVEWISRYQDKQAKAIGNYLSDPSLPSGNCTPHSIPLCTMSVDKRTELLNLLRKERLNLANSSFQWKYRLFPLDDKSPELTGLKVLSWGPNTVLSTVNATGVWIKLDQGLVDARSRLIVRINNQEIDVVVDGNVITFTIPQNISETVGKYPVELVGSFSFPIKIGILEVK